MIWVLMAHVLEMISVAERADQAYRYFYPLAAGNDATTADITATTANAAAAENDVPTTITEARGTRRRRYDLR